MPFSHFYNVFPLLLSITFGAVKKYRATVPVTEFVSVLPVILSSGRKSFHMISSISLMYKVVFVLLRGIIVAILGWAQSFPLNARGGVRQDEGYLQEGSRMGTAVLA